GPGLLEPRPCVDGHACPLQTAAPSARESWGATRRPPTSSAVTIAPKRKPPTWAKNATPPPFARAPKIPKFASTSWYRNQKPRKNHAETRTGQNTTRPRTCECG